MLLLKATYHPNWEASVDGATANTVMLMPGFIGVELKPGSRKYALNISLRHFVVSYCVWRP
ncbi:MAG: hypothetical protein Ct9H300mP11_25760 [Chloroflexota bacterium]|nr:MAG: hypothetical protein Ct9H300mP11_25760 [Chloroflexota bacterium]